MISHRKVWGIAAASLYFFTFELCGSEAIPSAQLRAFDDVDNVGGGDQGKASDLNPDLDDWDRELSTNADGREGGEIPAPPLFSQSNVWQSGHVGDGFGFAGSSFSEVLGRIDALWEPCAFEAHWVLVPDSLRDADGDKIPQSEEPTQPLQAPLSFLSRKRVTQCVESVEALEDALNPTMIHSVNEIFMNEDEAQLVGVLRSQVSVAYAFTDHIGLSAYVGGGEPIMTSDAAEDSLQEYAPGFESLRNILAGSLATVDGDGGFLSFLGDQGSVQFILGKSDVEEVDNSPGVAGSKLTGQTDVLSQWVSGDAATTVLPESEGAPESPELTFTAAKPTVLPPDRSDPMESDTKSTISGDSSVDFDDTSTRNPIPTVAPTEARTSSTPVNTPAASIGNDNARAPAVQGLSTCLDVRRYGVVESSYHSASNPQLFDSIKFPIILSIKRKSSGGLTNGTAVQRNEEIDPIDFDPMTEGIFECTLQAATTTTFELILSTESPVVTNLARDSYGPAFMQSAENRILSILQSLQTFDLSNASVTLRSHQGDAVRFAQRLAYMFSAATQTVPTFLTLQRMESGQAPSVDVYQADLMTSNFLSFSLFSSVNGSAWTSDFYELSIPGAAESTHLAELEAYTVAVLKQLMLISTERCRSTFIGKDGSQLLFFESLIDQPVVWGHSSATPWLRGGLSIQSVFMSTELVRPNDRGGFLTLRGRLQAKNVYEFDLIPRHNNRMAVGRMTKISKLILDIPDYLRELDFIRRLQATIGITCGGPGDLGSLSFNAPLTSIVFERMSRLVELDSFDLGGIRDSGTSWRYSAVRTINPTLFGATTEKMAAAEGDGLQPAWKVEILTVANSNGVVGQAVKQGTPMELRTSISHRQSPAGSTPTSYNFDLDGLITVEASPISQSKSEALIPIQIQILNDALADEIIELPLTVGEVVVRSGGDDALMTALSLLQSSSKISFHPDGLVVIGTEEEELLRLRGTQ